jgi:CDP-diacylglycerol--glycerol-3-phosphate 3-phosphatidyltransferase
VETKARHPVLGSLPHVLSLTRVLLVFAIYWPASRQDAPLFAVLVLLAVLTDILDGPLARHYGTANRFGANVDSASDLLFYISLPVWAYLFQPDLARTPKVFVPVAVFTVLYIAANVVSHKTFGALGVHNRLSRASGAAGVLVTFYSILWGLNTWLYLGLLAVLSADLAQRYGAVAIEMRRRRQGGAAKAQAR